MNRERTKWSTEEFEYLKANVGTLSLKQLSKKLSRTEKAILVKITKTKLTNVTNLLDGLQIKELATILNVSPHSIYKWKKHRDLNFTKSKILNCNVEFIKIPDFWRWAEQNKTLIYWDGVERNILGVEPGWLKEIRNQPHLILHEPGVVNWSNRLLHQLFYDYNSGIGIKELTRKYNCNERTLKTKLDKVKFRNLQKTHTKPWRTTELLKLKEMFNQGKTDIEISKALNRKITPILNKRKVLGLHRKKPDKCSYWTQQETELLLTLKDEEIIDVCMYFPNRTAISIKNKLTRLLQN